MDDRGCFRLFYMGSGYRSPDGERHEVVCMNFLSEQAADRHWYEEGLQDGERRKMPARGRPPAGRVFSGLNPRPYPHANLDPSLCNDCGRPVVRKGGVPLGQDLCNVCRMLERLEQEQLVALEPGAWVWVRGGQRGKPGWWRALPAVFKHATKTKVALSVWSAWPRGASTIRVVQFPADEPRFYRRQARVVQDEA